MFRYIKAKAIKKLIKENEKRCAVGFLTALDKYVYEKIARCVKAEGNGGKTLNESTVSLTK